MRPGNLIKELFNWAYDYRGLESLLAQPRKTAGDLSSSCELTSQSTSRKQESTLDGYWEDSAILNPAQ